MKSASSQDFHFTYLHKMPYPRCSKSYFKDISKYSTILQISTILKILNLFLDVIFCCLYFTFNIGAMDGPGVLLAA